MSHYPSHHSNRDQQRRPKPLSKQSIDLDRSENGSYLLGNLDHLSSLSSSSNTSVPPPPPSPPSPPLTRNTMAFPTRGWLTKKSFLLLTILVASIWFLAPSDTRHGLVNYVNNKAGQVLEKAPWPRPSNPAAVANPPFDMPIPFQDWKSQHNDAADPTTSVRSKPKLHTDPTRTTRCEIASGLTDSKGLMRPLVQYAIMIDAGSTGSRIHVYKFNYCGSAPELEDEYFKMIIGGLSDHGENPKGGADSLRPLLDEAVARIPEELRSCSPVAVKATAGLRLLKGDQAQQILDEVRRMLEDEYPFPIADGRQPDGSRARKGVEIMEGREEGVFAWITVNYLLNRIGGGTDAGAEGQTQTAAVMDLGGGSTQIVFEPTFKDPSQGMHPGEHVYQLKDFGARSYTLYQNSYLGYGLMQARQSINSLAAFAFSLAHPDAVRMGEEAQGQEEGFDWDELKPENTRIPSSCFQKGKTKKVKISQPGRKTKKQVEVTFVGTGAGFDACRRLIEVTMDKDAACSSPSCSFSGVYQPSLTETFQGPPIVALSYFYDRLAPLGLGPTMTVDEIARMAREVCSLSPKNMDSFPSEALAELNQRPEACLDLTFMHGLLSLGYGLEGQRKISIAKKLGGTELGWCLGAQLAVLEEEGLICKNKKGISA
ncbi:hypothetical protein IE53DRAFT_317051 [Violaceomyces palustris]|uniref:Uncharacterized protein n=1 Tax=Violaceomyces palustris TaxID=1673888 RepID=A0ACD0NVC1_9BASI|nr:hypothetical protein IE53DRAFT_317051 [Violaceomyces palustris]